MNRSCGRKAGSSGRMAAWRRSIIVLIASTSATALLGSFNRSLRVIFSLADGSDTPSLVHSTGMNQSRLPVSLGKRAVFFSDFVEPGKGDGGINGDPPSASSLPPDRGPGVPRPEPALAVELLTAFLLVTSTVPGSSAFP